MYEITPEIRKSREALSSAILCFYCNAQVRSDKPAFMQWDKVPQRIKDDLKNLKSEHISNLRLGYFY